MPETLKKIKRKIQQKPEPQILIGDVDEEAFTGELKNVELTLRYQHQPIKPIICPSCGAKHDRKWIKRKIDTIGLSRAVTLVDQKGKQNQKLIEFYAKAEKRRMSPREFFEGEDRIKKMYANIPSDERPISSTSQNIAITCQACDYKLGLIEVTAEAKPQRPAPPNVDVIIHLPKTPLEDRWMRERFHIIEADLNEWLDGKDEETVHKMEDLAEFEKKLRDFPYIQETGKQISDLKSAVHLTIEKMQQEIHTRSGRLYNLFAAPPDIINRQIARIKNAPLTDEEKKTEFGKTAGLAHVSSEIVQDLIKRGKLFPGQGAKETKEKTAREKEMEELGGKPIRR